MSTLAYRPEVDGLRAVAVLTVILFHAGLPWLPGGYVGVDVFFVISGYLITTIIAGELATRSFSIARFYERRARRILPALFLVMVVTAIPCVFWLTPAQFREFSQSIVAVIFFASNVLFARTSGYFDSATEEKPLLHTWSLGVEEQYYVLFPLVMMALWRFGRRRLVAVLAIVAIASVVLAEWLGRLGVDGNFYIAPTRAFELLIGSMLALAMFGRPQGLSVGTRAAHLASAAGLGMILWAAVFFDRTSGVPGVAALLPTVGAALVIAFATRGTAVAGVLSTRPMVAIGLVSYSAYLWHHPLFALARIRFESRPPPEVFAVLVLATFVLAWLTWRYVEAPFRDRRLIPLRPLVVSGVAMAAFLGGFGVAGHVTRGLPGRLDAGTLALMQTAAPSPHRAACHTKGRDFLDPKRACVYPEGGRPTWAALGDSHVVETASALAERLAPRGEALVHLSFSGCPPLPGSSAGPPGCGAWLEQALRMLEEDARIANVLVGFRHAYYLHGDHLDVYPGFPNAGMRIGGADAERSREMLWKGFASVIERLERAGKRVVVLMPVPELGQDVQKNIQWRMLGRAEYRLGTERAWYERRNAFVLERLAGLKWSDRLVPIDPAAFLCDGPRCRAIIDDESMYFDDDHLSVTGARRVLARSGEPIAR